MELWDAYNKNEEKVGVDLVRGRDIPKGLYHLVAEVLVQHKDGTYLLVKRDDSKETYPGYEDFGAVGSVLKGETASQAAYRELKEETGIIARRLKPLCHLISESKQTIYYGYLCITDCPKDSIRLQEGETSAYRWISKEEMLAFFNSNQIIPTRKLHLEDYIEYLCGKEIGGEEKENATEDSTT